MKITFTLLLFAATLVLSAQQQTAVFPESSSATGVQQMFYKTSIVKNAANDVFTCGATLNGSGSYDMLVTKHNSANVLQWSVTYNGSYGGDDYASDIALDALGNVYVTGTKQTGTQNYDAVLNKYNNAGTLQWSRAYEGSGNGPDGFTTVLVENNNAIYVAGGAYISLTNLTDVLSIKYDSSGTALWTNTWNNSTSSMQDAAVRIVNSGGQTYVYSASQTGLSPVVWKLAQPRYNSTTGAFVAAGISSGDDTAFSNVSDIAVDGTGHVLVAGTVQTATQGKNIRLARFNLSLIEQWVYDYNGSGNLDDEGAGLVLVGTAHAYLTGYTTSAGNDKDLFAAKIAITSGAVSWDHELDLSGGADRGVAISLDAAGNAYIGATSFKHGNDDMVVAVLASSTGNLLASNRYNSPHNLNDHAQKIALDQTNNEIFMAGQVETSPGSYSYMLTKWSVKTVYAPINTPPLALLGFQENKGQLLTDSVSNVNIRFYCNNSFPEVFLNDSLMSMVVRVKGDSIDSLQRIDMRFTKGNMYNRLYPSNAQQLFANYYLGYCDKIEKNYYYNDILKPSAYTNTDVIFQNGADGYAYWFVCRPGSTPTDIEMEYEGQNSLSVDANGRLHIVTAFGDIVQEKPTAYTMNLTTGVLTTLPWQPTYQINSGNKVSFNYGTWSGTLVIRVSRASSASLSYCATLNNLDWSTYFGYAPGGNEASLDIYTKNDATIYITGIAMGANFPVVSGESGAVDLIYNQGDGFVSCFDDEAVLLWSTFVGGNKADEGRAIEYNSTAADYRIYAAGNTYSNSAFSWAQTDEDDFSMQSNVEGWVQDGWIMRFDENYGTAQWGTYIGSPEEDQAIDLVALNNGHVLLIGNTRAEAISSAGCEPNSMDNLFPICADGGEYLDGSNDGNWDVFITKFGTNNAILWSTFYGNNDHQKAFEATGFGSSGTPGFVWIVGRGDVDGYQSGATESFLQNGTSNTAFILKFSSEGDLTWSTGLTGISGLQSVAMIKPVEQNSRLVVAGYTMDQAPDVELSCDAIPGKISICTPGGAYQDAVTENRDVYIAEFDKNSNELVWSTFYGTETNECIEVYEDDLAGNWPSLEYNYEKFMDITGDSRGYIYLTGTTSQEGNINHQFPLFGQTGWFQENYCDEGGYDGDAFILGFAANRELFWATFFEGLFADVEGLTIPYHSGCLAQLDAVSDQYLYFTGMSPNAYIPLACPPTPNPYCQEDQSSSFSSAIIGRFNIEQDAVLSDNTSFGDPDLFMSAYPVPTSDKFTLSLATNEPLRLRLFNSLGALVKELSVFPNVSQVEIDMRELADDIYLLEALNENGIRRSQIKIIKAQ